MKTIFLNLLLCLIVLSLNIGNALSQQNHEYVDLGLPSGTLWATCNVGANNEWEYGDYFAWGETSPKSIYNWSTYKYANGDYNKLTKYCSKNDYGNNGFTDGLKQLEPKDDAATVNWGNDWRMPTYEERNELINNCYWVWTEKTDNQGHKYIGYMVYKALKLSDKGVEIHKDKTPDAAYTYNVPHIFLPAAGYKYNSGTTYVGSRGNYWSSSLDLGSPNFARCLYFVSGYVEAYDGSIRCSRFSVRPVRCKN